MKNYSPPNEGFTLIEVVIGFAIISILLAGLYGLSVNSVKTTKASEIKQNASLLGQDIFEEFRSADVTKVVNGSGLELSNGMKLVGTKDNCNISGYDLGNGYKANITVIKNTSNIGSGQPLTTDTSPYNYTVYLKKTDLKSIYLSDNKENFGDPVSIDKDKNERTKIKAEVDETSTGKSIKVSIDGGDTFTKEFPYNPENKAAESQNEIRLSVNCEEYNLKTEDKDLDNGFEVDVYNHGKVPLNLCLEKSNTIDGIAYAEVGKLRMYNNRSSSKAVSEGDLYDINVEITNDSAKRYDGSDKGIVFTGTISQNLRITDKNGNSYP